jgi:hypothetical protein
MSRYFFNFRQGDTLSIDEEGSEFDSMEQAYLSAFRAAQDMWRDLLVARQDPLLCAFEITNSDGTELMLLPFSEILAACRSSHPINPLKPLSGAFQETLQGYRDNKRLMSDVRTTLKDARATVREARDLLSKATKSIGE